MGVDLHVEVGIYIYLRTESFVHALIYRIPYLRDTIGNLAGLQCPQHARMGAADGFGVRVQTRRVDSAL